MDAADWDRRYAAADRLAGELVWGAAPNRFVAELTPATAGSALDLACGEGRNAAWLAQQGWRVTALDFSAVAVDRGRALAPTVNWQVADVLTATLPAVDLVLLAYVHLPPGQRRLLLDRAAAAVRPGGALLLIGHDLRNLTDGVGGPQDPDLLWTPGDVRADGLVGAATTRAREVGENTAWDTVGLLRRPASDPRLPHDHQRGSRSSGARNQA